MTISSSMLRFVLASIGLVMIIAIAAPRPAVARGEMNGYDSTKGLAPKDDSLTKERGGKDGVRPDIARSLKDAQDANQQQNWTAARAKLDEADAVSDKAPIEVFYINVTRATTDKGAGDLSGAAKALAAALETGKANPDQALVMMANITNLYIAAKDYPATVLWSQRYAKAGGKDPAVSVLVIQAEYLSGDYAGAAREGQAAIDAAEQAHQKPTEDQLQLVGNCFQKLNNDAGYTSVLEKLVTFYPTPQYWADLIAHVARKPGFPGRLMLDIYRLQHATGALITSNQYTDMVELDLQEGISSEAKAIADEGAAKGLVAKPLQNKATAAAAEDRKKLDRDEKEAAGMKDGNLLISIGYTYIGFADYQKGIAALEQGIAKGGLKHPEEARQELGIAYFQAGQAEKAIATFDSVSGTGPAGDVARLWAMRMKQGI
ncbi:MAG: hypothetical protein WDN69_27695 [Aliidongia sp.]